MLNKVTVNMTSLRALCLTSLVTFYDGIRTLVEKDILCLGLCKALDTVLDDTLVSKLDRHGF